ncbi:MAG: PrpF domain-containing protein [Burkholderiales bacterium]
MPQRRIPAVFMRGGTANAIVFHQKDLPTDRKWWDDIFLAATGSPDPYGRQLDGMGGGYTAVSKVCVIGPPTRDDADIDYTFAQIPIKEQRVEYAANCGNMSAAMGPFAVDERLVQMPDANGEALVRIHNTNTKKIIHARFPLVNGCAAVDGDLEIPGIAGSGAPVRLDFISPGGAATGNLLPTGNVRDTLDVPGVGKIEVSMVDAANPCVFVRARDVGLKGSEPPAAVEADAEVMRKFAAIRCTASVAMGITRDIAEAATRLSNPAIGYVSAPQDYTLSSGELLRADDIDVTGRMIARGQAHRDMPLTRTLCMAVASRIAGSIVHEATRITNNPDAELRIGMPAGVITAAAEVRLIDGQWVAARGSFLRTQRRLFEGSVLVRGSHVAPAG